MNQLLAHRPARSTTLILALALAGAGLVWGLVGLRLANERAQVLAETQATARNIAIGLKEHSKSSIQATDAALRLLKYHYEISGAQQMPMIRSYFEHKVVDISFLNQVGVINTEGVYELSNLPNHKRIDLSDREHFRIHQEGYPYPLFISKPVIGRASGKWSVQLTRKLSHPDGSFKGVAVASFDPHYFLQHYSKLDLGPESLMGMIGFDGFARTLRVGDKTRVDDAIQKFALPEEVAAQGSGQFVSDQLFDRVRRIYVYQRLEDQPLVALVGISEAYAYAGFERRRAVLLVLAGALTLLIALFAGHQLRGQHQTASVSDDLGSRRKLVEELRAVREDCERRLAAMRRDAAVGQAGARFATEVTASVDALAIALGDVRQGVVHYERLIEASLQLRFGQINQEEFAQVLEQLEPTQALESLRGDLDTLDGRWQAMRRYRDALGGKSAPWSPPAPATPTTAGPA